MHIFSEPRESDLCIKSLVFNWNKYKSQYFCTLYPLVALIIPIPSDKSYLAGYPIDTYLEFIFLLVIIILWTNFLKVKCRKNKFYSLILISSSLLIILKFLTTFAPQPHFEACYDIENISNQDTFSEVVCESSWLHPFSRHKTRNDFTLNFGLFDNQNTSTVGFEQSNWNLSSLNNLEFNYYKSGDPDRNRLPFKVTWKTIFTTKAPLEIEYIGEGFIRINKELTTMPRSYINSNKILLSHPKRIENLEIFFQWSPDEIKSANFAQIRLSDKSGDIDIFQNSTLKNNLYTLIQFTQIFLALFLVLHLLSFTTKLRLLNKYVIFFNLTFFLIQILFFTFRGSVLMPWLTNFLLFLLIYFNILFLKDKAANIFNSGLIIFISYLHSVSIFSFVSRTVNYRSPGDDPLTYESFAHEILNGNPFWGGENVFVYSPAMRYWLAINHLLFGEADYLISFLSLLMILFSFLYVLKVSVQLQLNATTFKLKPYLHIFLLFLFALFLSFELVLNGGDILLSEYPTWPIIMLVITSLFQSISYKKYLFLVFLLSLLYFFRGNQILASLFILILTNFKFRHKIKTKFDFQNFSVTTSLYLLPAAFVFIHNYVYGKSFYFLQTSVSSSFIINPLSLFRLPISDNLIQSLNEQLGGVLIINSVIRNKIGGDLLYFSNVAHLVILCFSILFIFMIFRRNNYSLIDFFTLLIPFFFLVPHIFVQVYVTYPRHTIAGYLSMLLITFLHLSKLDINSKEVRNL